MIDSVNCKNPSSMLKQKQTVPCVVRSEEAGLWLHRWIDQHPAQNGARLKIPINNYRSIRCTMRKSDNSECDSKIKLTGRTVRRQGVINQRAADRQGSGIRCRFTAVSVATCCSSMLFRRENSGASLYFGRTSQGRSVCGLASSPGGCRSEFSIFIVVN